MNNIVVEGHRGWAANYPENTMLSYIKAMELGVDAIEFDVWLTSDKVPVLMHDGNAARTCGVSAILREMTHSAGNDPGRGQEAGTLLPRKIRRKICRSGLDSSYPGGTVAVL